MANYKEGVWYGWNGGECPVHPKSRVRGLEDCGAIWTAEAGDCNWESMRGGFLVVKEYREPRDFWLVHVPGDVTEFTLHHCEAAALLEQREEGGRILHVREVL